MDTTTLVLLAVLSVLVVVVYMGRRRNRLSQED